jgi:(R,R)-butanediol dehydrogenase/meso-butanediol dehydrogenase/diacetyl reductase
MRSAIFKGLGEPLAIEQRAAPDPTAAQVVIKVARCGICASDLKMTQVGNWMSFTPGAAIGHEYAGEIVAVGKDVEGLQISDRVTAIPAAGCGQCEACARGDPYGCSFCSYLMGGFSEYTVAAAPLVMKLPVSLSMNDGALVEPLACGSQAARYACPTAHSRVLVLGAGSIGLGAIYWSVMSGCTRIAVAALSGRNAGLAARMGATDFLLQGKDLPSRVAETLGGPPDIVFECAGAPGLIATSIDCVRVKGTIVSSGTAVMKQVRLAFSMGYIMSDFGRAIAALDAGHIEPRAMISETIALDALPGMFEALRTDRSRCKVLVAPGE